MNPTDSVASQSFLSFLMEVLDNSTSESWDQPFSLDRLTKALESFEKNKTSRSDGLLAELYSALWDLICQNLLEGYDVYMQDTGVDTCLINLDQEKAFDRMSHMTDYPKVLGIWFGRAGAYAKTWEERVLKMRQKL
eukprot:g20094.t1